VDEVRAKDVQVAKLFQAQCLRPGCEWKGDLWHLFAEAGDERQDHLDEHRRSGTS
jgi:hypothetical protein